MKSYFDYLLADYRRERRIRFVKKLLVSLLILTSLLYASVAHSTTSYVRAPEPTKKEVIVKEHIVVVATITAYTSSVDETDDTPFITASGSRTGEGTLACPPKYKFGTKILINGKEYTCLDRMNRRYWEQERFDMWVETKGEAFEWGIKKLEVKIINNA